MTNNLEYIKLDDRIYVYKNVLLDPIDLVNILKDSEKNPENSFLFRDWAKWSVFGTYVYEVGKNMPIPVTEEQRSRLLLEQSYHDNVLDVFHKTTEHFLNTLGMTTSKEWGQAGPSYSKYLPENISEGIGHPNLSMLYHTDYEWMDPDSPGDEFMLTCTMYLNDDYEGGGLKFAFKDKRIDYKPQVGDVIIFPSGHPELLSEDGIYYHGVDKVLKNDKYLIRVFYTKYNPGTKSWWDNFHKYGEELWTKMEKERISEAVKKTTKSFRIEQGDIA